MKAGKKWIAIFVCLALLMSMSACGAQENIVPSVSETTAATVIILTESENYSVVVDQMVPINASIEGGDPSVTLSYASMDESIATVNKYGKVVGVSAGTVDIVITASDGTEKTVCVTVEGPLYENVLRVALNVLYNDSTLGCTNTEVGPYVEIYGDGQYTLTFDCTMHLSESSRKMGVTNLSNLTSVFLYDQDVRNGTYKTSPVTACEIRWDSVSVNGQELTITNSDFKSALKTSGIFDSNDPLNAWDGSAVEEVTVDTENHVLNIQIEDPVTITVTFTIQGLTFTQE